LHGSFVLCDVVAVLPRELLPRMRGKVYGMPAVQMCGDASSTFFYVMWVTWRGCVQQELIVSRHVPGIIKYLYGKKGVLLLQKHTKLAKLH
jgi:hypothetical protein